MTVVSVPVLLGALLFAYLTTLPARAAVPDACGLVTEHQIARAFGLADAIEHTQVLVPPGNPSGVLRIGCRVFVWSGTKPTSDKLKRKALLEGRLAWLNVDTWVTEQSPYAPVWREHFDAELGALRTASVDLFLRRLHGRTFVPPRYGADEAIAYESSTRKTVRLRALWWKRSDKSLLEMEVEEARGKPALAALKRIAAVVAERFNTECVYPCEPPATG
jgi:hypothetical protein